MTRWIWIFIFTVVLLLSPQTTFAESSYVLPYPSFMPGNKIYSIHSLFQDFQEYWSFGNLSKAKYYQAQTDKYLVEAKILFEYKQYLLAEKALSKSDEYYEKEVVFLNKAKAEGKDITFYLTQFHNQTVKHIEEIEKIKAHVPQQVVWTPEDNVPTTLNLEKDLEKSIEIRKDCL